MREGWTYKKLGEICKVITKGTTPTTIGYKFTDNGINFIKIECIDSIRNLIKENLTFISEECNNSMIRSQLQEKDLLFSIAGALGRIYIVEKSVLPANTNQALAIIRLSDKQDLFLLFLSYFLNSNTIKRQIEKDKVGVAQFNLSLGQIKDFIIPIPSIAEQQHIVSELDLLSSIIEKKKAQLKEYDQLAQSIFYDMFGDPVTNEKGWEVKKLGELALVKTGPFGSMLHKQDYISNGTPLVNPIHMKDFHIIADMDFTISDEKVKELDKYILQKGDVIFARRGDIGRCAVVTEKENGYLCGTGSLFVRFVVEVVSTYIMYIIRSSSFTNELVSNAKGATMLNLNSSIVEDLRLPLPPLSLQQSFASKIESIERQKSLIQQSVKEVQTLFDSRMDYYFN